MHDTYTVCTHIYMYINVYIHIYIVQNLYWGLKLEPHIPQVFNAHSCALFSDNQDYLVKEDEI